MTADTDQADPPIERPRWIVYDRIRDLVPAETNPKTHDLARIGDSIITVGFVEPIIHDGRTGRMVAGHGRIEALQALEADGSGVPEGVTVDDDGAWRVPVVHGWESRDDAEARAYLLAANRLPERGGWDPDGLADMLADLDQEAGHLRDMAGWDDDAFRELMADTGRLAQAESGFLDDLAEGDPAPAEPEQDRHRTGTDMVDLRLPMTAAERDEAIAALRRHQRARGLPTLAATAIALFRDAPGA